MNSPNDYPRCPTCGQMTHANKENVTGTTKVDDVPYALQIKIRKQDKPLSDEVIGYIAEFHPV